ncbi:Thioredoxin H-type [Dichanthelium oligosanthes]|uniref:Thioredoxin H-type n=1 Tax=Dichanthelium oligosanthes TaxID=888268 RepID=A0A1E5WB79_9POAL|nr:Thioredoxin H-type [Dichanthelium oligosanthes]
MIEEANSSNKLVVIKFTASWCRPSRIIAPFFADLAKNFPDVIFLKVDIDDMEDIAEQFRVRGAPYFLFMKGGEVLRTGFVAQKRKSWPRS